MSKKSRLQRDLDIQEEIRGKLAIDIGAPVDPDTRLSALVGTAVGAVKRFMPIIPVVAKVAPAMAVASDHHRTTIGEAVREHDDNGYRVSSPNRQAASSKMRHHRVR